MPQPSSVANAYGNVQTATSWSVPYLAASSSSIILSGVPSQRPSVTGLNASLGPMFPHSHAPIVPVAEGASFVHMPLPPSIINTKQPRAPRKLQPITEAVIPTLPRGRKAFKHLMIQWDEVDPKTGYALKDWPTSWYTNDMRLFNGAKYSERRLVALEFIER